MCSYYQIFTRILAYLMDLHAALLGELEVPLDPAGSALCPPVCL